MAQKRMFDRAITETEKFMDMPMSSKGLYFLLGMAADDEGFVSAKSVLRVHGGTDDDLNILIAKGFCIRFPSGILVITDWHDNNYLDKNRIKRTQYQDERKLLSLTNTRKYVFNNGLTSTVESSTVQIASKEAGNANTEPELTQEDISERFKRGREQLGLGKTIT